MSGRPPVERQLTPAERARLRADVFAAIDGEERTRRRRRRTAGASVVLVAVAALTLAALRTPDTPTTDTAGSMSVRCTLGDESVPGGVIVVSARQDPRLVCSELWRRGEFLGAARKPAPMTACARTDTQEILVLLASDSVDGCRGSTAQQ